jgi:hypothetical protein
MESIWIVCSYSDESRNANAYICKYYFAYYSNEQTQKNEDNFDNKGPSLSSRKEIYGFFHLHH